MKKRLTAGFTLIELMVAIAIIALLMIVVIVSMSAPRAKAADLKVRLQSNNIQAEADSYHDDTGTYTTDTGTDSTCDYTVGDSNYPCTGIFATPKIAKMIKDLPSGVQVSGRANQTSFAFTASLPSTRYLLGRLRRYFAVDNTGASYITASGNIIYSGSTNNNYIAPPPAPDDGGSVPPPGDTGGDNLCQDVACGVCFSCEATTGLCVVDEQSDQPGCPGFNGSDEPPGAGDTIIEGSFIPPLDEAPKASDTIKEGAFIP